MDDALSNGESGAGLWVLETAYPVLLRLALGPLSGRQACVVEVFSAVVLEPDYGG